MAHKYAAKVYDKEQMARVVGRSLSISAKQSVEICSFIKNKGVQEAKNILKKDIEKKQAGPFKRYNRDRGHKTKIGPGRYPEKASEEILKLLDAVEANAQFKGLNTSNLIISHICSHKAQKSWHYGRKRRRKMKRTHLEIIVKEVKETKK